MKSMTHKENLYLCAMEECSQLAQALSKSARFGKYNHHPDHPEICNEDTIIEKYYQLRAVMEQLFEKDGFRKLSEQEIDRIANSKCRKMECYSNLSRDLGIVSENLK